MKKNLNEENITLKITPPATIHLAPPALTSPFTIDDWYFIENIVKRIMHIYDFYEIRTSAIQPNSLYKRFVDYSMNYRDYTTDEMLLTIAQSNEWCLRPEGTLSILNHPISDKALKTVQKVFYMGEMYYCRQGIHLSAMPSSPIAPAPLTYYQIGAEILGSSNVISDIEIIHLAKRILRNLGISNYFIEINSAGCSRCIKRYQNAVREYVLSHKDFCSHCLVASLEHPLHIFKCTNKKCQKLARMAPIAIDYLCEDCIEYFDEIKKLLANLGSDYQINPALKTRFEYYSRMMFNIYIIEDGLKIDLASGGRYDTLASHIKQTPLPAVGMSFDVEKLMIVMYDKALFKSKRKDFRICICTANENMELLIVQVAQEIHDENISTVIYYEPINADNLNHIAKKHNCNATLLFKEDLIREGKVMLITYDQSQNIAQQDHILLPDIMDNIHRIRKVYS